MIDGTIVIDPGKGFQLVPRMDDGMSATRVRDSARYLADRAVLRDVLDGRLDRNWSCGSLLAAIQRLPTAGGRRIQRSPRCWSRRQSARAAIIEQPVKVQDNGPFDHAVEERYPRLIRRKDRPPVSVCGRARGVRARSTRRHLLHRAEPSPGVREEGVHPTRTWSASSTPKMAAQLNAWLNS
jgi:hypothetical protein